MQVYNMGIMHSVHAWLYHGLVMVDLTSLSLVKSYVCPNTSDETLEYMGK